MTKKTPIALYLASLRRNMGLTQGELDLAAGLPKGTVAHLEAGSKLFSAVRIQKLAAYFQVTENSFMDAVSFSQADTIEATADAVIERLKHLGMNIHAPPQPNTVDISLLSDEQREAWDFLLSLPPKRLAATCALLKDLLLDE